MTDQQKQIEALADALTSERAVRCQEMALLEEKIDKLQRRIETLEGKERSAVYDPVSGKTVEAVTDTLSIRACKVMTEEDIKIQIEQAARSAADSFAEALGQVKNACESRAACWSNSKRRRQKPRTQRLSDMKY